MSSISVAVTDSLWIATVGFCVLAWGLVLLMLVAAGARRRRFAARIQKQLNDMAAQAAHYERQRDECNLMLVDARREISEISERYSELAARFELAQQSLADSARRRRMGGTVPPPAPEPRLGDSEAKDQIQRLEETLAEARRSRERAEQKAEALRSANQGHLRKIAAMTRQLEEIAHSMQDTQRALTDKQREITDLQAQAAASTSQMDTLVEQLQCAEGTHQEVERLTQCIAEVQKSRQALSSELEAARGIQAELVQQLQEKTTGYAAAERMLQESTTAQVQLRRDLRAITLGREELELQNLELKRMLEQLGQPASASLRAPGENDADAVVQANLGAAAEWDAITESDISEVLGTVVEAPTKKLPDTGGAKRETPRREVPEPAAIDRELREARLRIELLEANMGDLEYLREQNAKLSDEWAQDRGAARELTALQMEHKRLRLDMQLATEKIAAQSRSLERIAQLEAELQEYRVETEQVASLRRQLRELDAENFALRNANSGTFKIAASAGPESDAHELNVVPLQAAALSDKLGLPIAATGRLPAESLAAISGLAISNAERVRELLPVGPISMVQWVDQYGMTVTCKLLTMAGDEMAMTTLGAGRPSEEALHQTLKSVLSSIGWTEKGPVADDASDTATG